MGFFQTQSDLETELPSEQNLIPAKFSKVSKVYDDKRLSLSPHTVVNSSKLCSSLKIPNFHISITVQDSSLSELLCVVVVDRCDGQTWPDLEKLNEPLVVALI